MPCMVIMHAFECIHALSRNHVHVCISTSFVCETHLSFIMCVWISLPAVSLSSKRAMSSIGQPISLETAKVHIISHHFHLHAVIKFFLDTLIIKHF